MGRVVGWIDMPAAGALLDPRELWVEGWAYASTYPLRVVVTTVDGTQEDLAPVAVRFRPVIVGRIDVPDLGAVLDPRGLWVFGWACASISPVSCVDVFLGDHWLGRAGLGRLRPDVARTLAEPNAELSGFELRVAKPPVPAGGQVSLRAVVTVVDGTQGDLAPVPVQFRPISEPPPPDAPLPPIAGSMRHLRRRSGDVIRVLWSAPGLDQGGSQLRMA